MSPTVSKTVRRDANSNDYMAAAAKHGQFGTKGQEAVQKGFDSEANREQSDRHFGQNHGLNVRKQDHAEEYDWAKHNAIVEHNKAMEAIGRTNAAANYKRAQAEAQKIAKEAKTEEETKQQYANVNAQIAKDEARLKEYEKPGKRTAAGAQAQIDAIKKSLEDEYTKRMALLLYLPSLGATGASGANAPPDGYDDFQ
jgi:hypothetical protein